MHALFVLYKIHAMSRPTLDYFQKIIDEHFERENLIMKEMLAANLTKEEWIQLQSFIREHSHSKFVKQMRRANN